MKHSRTKTRRLLLQQLYSRIYRTDIDRFSEAFFEGRFDFEPDLKYIEEMTEIVIVHQDTLLDIIAQYAPRFDIDTMLKTNILALLIALAEMLYLEEEIPAKVSIDEAISLAKYFGDESSQKIVNAILDSFYKHIEKHQKEQELNPTMRSRDSYHFFSQASALQSDKK